jgi:hypothetical protein
MVIDLEKKVVLLFALYPPALLLKRRGTAAWLLFLLGG